MIIAEDIKKMLRVLEAENDHKLSGKAKDRKFLRSDVKWRATIRCEQGHACLHEEEREVSGVIRDISANGARIDVNGLFFEKNNLMLTITEMGALRCDLVWRRGNKIGVQFSEDPQYVLDCLRKIIPEIDQTVS